MTEAATAPNPKGIFDRSTKGQTTTPVTVEVERDRIRFFAKVLGETNPIHSDLAAARALGHPANKVDFIFGLARNKRLEKMLAGEMAEAKTLCEKSGQPERVFKDFRYQTLDSWSKERRVVGKAEHTVLGSNPRFVVTTFNNAAWKARELYEELYCARGEVENRIGEQFELFADRAS